MITPTNDNPQPVLNLPPVVQTLCIVTTAVYALQYFVPGLMTDDVLYALAFVPGRYTGAVPFDLAAATSPFTYLFVHGGWMHLAFNMFGLMAFGAGLEKKISGRRLLLFYITTGLCGALTHTLFYPHDPAPMVGASGAISGLFGGVIIMMQEAGLMGSGYRRLLPIILIWIGSSLFFGIFGLPGVDNAIAWATHIGGFFAGLFLYRPFLRLKIAR